MNNINFQKKYTKHESLIMGVMPDEYQVVISNDFIKFHDKNSNALMTIEEKKVTCYVCLSVYQGGLFGVYMADAMAHMEMCLSRFRQNLAGRYCTLCGTHWLDRERIQHYMSEEHIKSYGHQQLFRKAAEFNIHRIEERAKADKSALLRSQAEFFLNGGVMTNESATPYIKTAIDLVMAFPNLDDVVHNSYVDVFYSILGKIGGLEITIIMKALENYEELGSQIYEAVCAPVNGGLFPVLPEVSEAPLPEGGWAERRD